jgi:hypothetical protein
MSDNGIPPVPPGMTPVRMPFKLLVQQEGTDLAVYMVDNSVMDMPDPKAEDADEAMKLATINVGLICDDERHTIFLKTIVELVVLSIKDDNPDFTFSHAEQVPLKKDQH